ncbi:MAG: hypothetical protein HJJLKODD_00760 [Phycisphaerae bacterium]|nr:hypothetical protein [Phycisphaerae bacterium]
MFNFDGHYGAYLSVLLALWVAGLGVPIPEDIALLTGGYLCYSGYAKLPVMIVVAVFGVITGDLLIFTIGRRWASNLWDHRLTRRLITPERIVVIKRQFRNHQMKTVFIARFMPGMRVPVFMTAGAVGMSYRNFLIANGGAAIWSVPLFVSLGYVFGHSFEKLKTEMAEIEHVIVLILISAAALWFLWHTYAKSAKAREEKRLLTLAEASKNSALHPVNGDDNTIGQPPREPPQLEQD